MKPPPPPVPFFRNRKLVILSLTACALIMRVLFLFLFSHTLYWDGVWSDSAAYNQWAHRIVTDHDWIGKQPFFMTPLYPYVLALVYSMFGFTFLPVRILQLLAGVGTVLGIYIVGEKSFSPKAGFIAGVIASVYGPFLLSGNLILVETLKVFFVVLALFFLLLAHERSGARWWIASGVALGLAILCRPTDVLVLAVAIAWGWAGAGVPRKEKAIRLGGLMLGAALVVAPVAIRNLAVSGDLIMITSNGGLNFYLGNNPKAVGVYYNVDDIDLVNDPDGHTFAEESLRRPLGPSQVSAYYAGKARDFIIGQPLAFLQLMGKKTILFFHSKEIGQMGYDYQFIEKTSIPFLSYLPTFAIVGPLSLLGCLLAFKDRKKLWLVYGVLAAEFFGVVIFFVTDRFRLSAMPLLIVFAGAGIAFLHDQWLQRDWKRLARSGLLFAIAIVPVDVLNYPLIDEYSLEYEYIGQMYFDARQYSGAMDALRQALRYRNTYHVHNSMGNVYLATANPKGALKEFEMGNSLDSRQPFSAFGIGSVFASQQNWEPALEAYNRAIAISPRFPSAYLNKGLTLYYLQRYPEALAALEQYVELEKDRSKLVTVYKDIANLKSLVAGGARDTTEGQRKQ